MDSQASTHKLLENMLLDKNAEPRDLPLPLLKEITNNFSDDRKIGSGGFGVVYKGILRNGQVVAVKKLDDKVNIDEKKFNQEVGCLMRVKHRNIVRFLGYCADTQGKICDYGGEFVMADVRQRLLCFEFLPNQSLREYINDASCDLEWSRRYQIIKGICNGLRYLHRERIVHLDLKPANILLDHHMEPKIVDFGLSRRFGEEQSRAITSKIFGSLGYLAPESFGGVMTFKSDIYSLGVIIQEILTGQKNNFEVEKVLESWRNRLGISSPTHTQLKQIEVCSEMSIICMHPVANNRPDIQSIIKRLDVVENIQHNGMSTSSVAERSPGDINTELITVYPTELCFQVNPNRHIQCTISLTNKTEDEVAFLIMPTEPEKYICVDECYVSPHSTCVLYVAMQEQVIPPSNMDALKILFMNTWSRNHIPKDLEMMDSHSNTAILLDNLCGQILKKGGEVNKVSLKAVNCNLDRASRTVEPMVSVRFGLYEVGGLKSIDVHPTEPWILTGHARGVCISKKNPQLNAFETFRVPTKPKRRYLSVKFIARQQWAVSGDSRGEIHVYTHIDGLEKVKTINAHSGAAVKSLAVHATQPYLLSSGDDHLIKLWDWDAGWVCKRCFVRDEYSLHSFQEKYTLHQVCFNPMDTDKFASISANLDASVPATIKFWRIDSANPNPTDELNRVYGGRVACYLTGSDQQYMAIVGKGGTTTILDVQSRAAVHACKSDQHNYCSPSAVACHPELPLLVTATKWGDNWGEVFLWNYATYRLEKALLFEDEVKGFGFINTDDGSKRLVIGFPKTIEIVEIDCPTLVGQDQNNL